MATVVQTSTIVHVNGADSTTVALTGVVAGNGIALLLATYSGETDVGQLSDTGSATFTRDFRVQNTQDANGILFIYRAENVAAGTHTVTINPVGASASITATLHEIGSTSTSATSDGTPAGTNGNSTAATSGNITILADSLLIGLMSHVDSGTVTLTPTYTQLAEDETTTDMPAAMSSRGDGGGLTAGSYSLDWTTGIGVHWMTGVAAWKTPAAAPPYTPGVFGLDVRRMIV